VTTGNDAKKGIEASSIAPPLPPRSRPITRGGLNLGTEIKRRMDQRKVTKEATLNIDQLELRRTLSAGSSNSSTEAPPKKRIGTTDNCDESQDSLMWDHYDGENINEEENLNKELPASQDCTGTEVTVAVPAAADHAVASTTAIESTTPHEATATPEAAATGADIEDKTVAMEESSQDSTKWEGTSSDDDRTLQALEAKEAVSQLWSEEGSGDLIVAPEANTSDKFEATIADNDDKKMDKTVSGKLTTLHLDKKL
jgi:hypothetical protein